MKKVTAICLCMTMLCAVFTACAQEPATSQQQPSAERPQAISAPQTSASSSASSSADSQLPSSSESTSVADSSSLPQSQPPVALDSDIVQPDVWVDYEIYPTTTAEVNFRKGPGTEYESMLLIPIDTVVREVGYLSTNDEWMLVEYDGMYGWVSKEWVWAAGDGIAKPVIYLYPQKPMDVEVTVEFANGGFTCTYPEYKDGWNVRAYPDGKIVDNADGLEYSYLYWEGESSIEFDFSSGFVVAGGDTAAFLREKLAYMGLTPREYNEFIVYWLPLMQHNPYNLITFQTTCYTDNIQLNVSPQPDSMLRIYMVYEPLQQPVDIPEQVLQPFEREGFAVVEWGGGISRGEGLG